MFFVRSFWAHGEPTGNSLFFCHHPLTFCLHICSQGLFSIQASHVVAALSRKSQVSCLIFKALIFLWHLFKPPPTPIPSWLKLLEHPELFLLLECLAKASPFYTPGGHSLLAYRLLHSHISLESLTPGPPLSSQSFCLSLIFLFTQVPHCLPTDWVVGQTKGHLCHPPRLPSLSLFSPVP